MGVEAVEVAGVINAARALSPKTSASSNVNQSSQTNLKVDLQYFSGPSKYVPNNDKWIAANKTMSDWAITNGHSLKIGKGTDIGKLFVFDKKGKAIGEIHIGQKTNTGVEYQKHYQPYRRDGKTDPNYHLWFLD
ncbi:hypothetical protein ACFLFF_31895 [Brevibacillus reuszeri]|uniref:hypothetical protein n=1 Tax=Brevibacillus reuszeri TaxID=54915 RepID=UPI00366F547E